MSAAAGPDPALEEAERRVDEAWRRTRVQAWLEARLGDGPYDPAAHRRELDHLAALVRVQARAGVPTWLDRPPPPSPTPALAAGAEHAEAEALPAPPCRECGEAVPEARRRPGTLYCSRACGRRAASRRFRDRRAAAARAGKSPTGAPSRSAARHAESSARFDAGSTRRVEADGRVGTDDRVE